MTTPILRYVKSLRTENPRDIVTVYIPEYVVGHWWEQILHNQSAFRLKTRLLFTPGVMVTSVPFLLRSSDLARKRLHRETEAEQAAPQLPPVSASTSPEHVAGQVVGPVEVGAVAHGGHCVARLDVGDGGPGRVVFVRHALPGERVLVTLTDTSHARFWRGDATEVLVASPDRVEPRCPVAGPGGCAAVATGSTRAWPRSVGSRRPWWPSSCSAWPA